MIETGKDLDDTIDHALEGAFRKSFMGRLMIALRDDRDALRALVDGDITSRKAMVYDNDSKTRLANDHQKKLDEALTELEESVGMAELYKTDNDDLAKQVETLQADKVLLNKSNERLVASLSKKGAST